MAIVILILFLLVNFVYLVYWIKTLFIMKDEMLFLVLGIFLSPFPQIGFYLTQRETMYDDQITTMKRFFIVLGVWTLLFITVTFMTANEVAAQQGGM